MKRDIGNARDVMSMSDNAQWRKQLKLSERMYLQQCMTVICTPVQRNLHFEWMKSQANSISFDNANFNTKTMTGHNTFHSMGGVRCSTPALQISLHSIPRLPHLTAAVVTTGKSHINICWYKKLPKSGLNVVVKELVVTP
ncbi:hypothetical protein PR048_011159 [Dryococelus australis]|uniref:Uncharacterized protein n=1 Tax=Dryococelus australis TaxID=614101 RepID=A0ABQ9HM43_9NEOP|nr:hypothetical protein PR048_011159 [Dryococelus australis]